MPRINDIPKLPQAHYEVDVAWEFLEDHLSKFIEAYQLDMNPDFQRGHVWSKQQQIAYVEWILRGGESGKILFFNCLEWNSNKTPGPMVLVDGKQRLAAVLAFLHDEIPAFGYKLSEYEDKNRLRTHIAGFKFRVASLETRADVLRWYLAINAGGTPHSPAEIARVEALLAQE
jgi:hypothetical protein